MFEPIRGGTRGGQAEFKWSDVSADKDRENYLGHSINAPTGRWQKNKDVHWYNRDLKSSEEQRAEEIRKVKEAEAEALSVALGFGPSKKESSPSTRGTGTNAIPIPPSTAASRYVNPDVAVKAAGKAERKQRRKERREEKAARRAEKAAHKEQHSRVHNGRSHHADSPPRSLTPVRQQRDSRSPSPKRHRSHDFADRDDSQDDRFRQRSRGYHSPDSGRFRDRRSSRSRSPPQRDSRSHSELPPRRPTNPPRKYDEDERESERFRDRQRWDHNATRQTPVGVGVWGRR
ncbi:kinase phosphorylation protein-domain-containing protein [Russula ochroleuca]|jgi:hypothetical protein|uniref:Kinase phosphorylation protein-domain-containing protein n=1 Tax=Russula ochroleuca TaxID=152965 RepID=A0A9P5JXT5_9AGAM|nr:kinase phosphorylation protein-domain-containing protein [Russula ochroleuca]